MNEKDIHFWEGFDLAIDLVSNYLNQLGEMTAPSIILDEILDEVDLYKKDG